MYIHVTYLSDICTGDGKTINIRYWNGREQCYSTLRWPWTERPTEAEWTTWKKTLTMTLALGRRDSLANHLSNWMREHRQQDGYFIKKEGEHLVQKTQGQWYIFTKIPS